MALHSHIVSIAIDKSKSKKSLQELNRKYPNSKTKFVRDRNDIQVYLFHNKSNQSSNQLHSELVQIDGILSVEITSERKNIPKLSKRYSFFLLIGLIILWIIFSSLAFLTTLLDQISNTQSLVIEISFAIAVAFWLFRYDQKWQQDVVDVLLDIDILSSEIKEYVKDLELRNSKP